MRLYDSWESGNGYKVRLLLAPLGIAHERVELDILAKVLQWMGFEPYSHEPYITLYAYTHVASEGGFELEAVSVDPRRAGTGPRSARTRHTRGRPAAGVAPEEPT